MKTAENKDLQCNNVNENKKNVWKFFIGMAGAIILYVSYQLFIK